MRKDSSLSPSLSSYSLSSSNECDGSLYEGCSFTQSNRPTLTSTNTTFISCTFASLRSSENGSAIYCTGNDIKLCIKGCFFQSCESSSGFGGAIYIEDISSFFVTKTVFFNCKSTNKRGGGLYFTSSCYFPLVSDTSFISCYARNYDSIADPCDDGGGLIIFCSLPSSQLNYILQSCRFLSYGCNDFAGGGYIVLSSSRIGCTGCLFSGCKCSNAEGIGISLDTADANVLIVFCFFSCTAGSNSPTDITINYHAESFSSSPIFHSFSTKDPSKSVSTCVSWQNYQYRNWLPHASN